MDKIVKFAQAFGVPVAVLDDSLLDIAGADGNDLCLCRGFDSAGKRVIGKLRLLSEEERWTLYDHIVKNLQPTGETAPATEP